MEITLNHTIVPSHNNVESAKFYSRIFGFEYVGEWGHFAIVKVNSTLQLDFQEQKDFSSVHYAFKVSEHQFDEILKRIKTDGVDFGSGPYTTNNEKINIDNDGRAIYFHDANGHVLEIMTQDYKVP